MRHGARRLLILAAIFLHGCGGDQPLQRTDVKRVPVSGRVVAGRQPVPGAVVTLVPKFEWNPDLPNPKAVTEADGSFEIGTVMTGDGAPPGEYLVSITSPESGIPFKIEAKFEDPERSGIRAIVKNDPSKLSDFVVRKVSAVQASGN